jgi:hypothetical protein
VLVQFLFFILLFFFADDLRQVLARGIGSNTIVHVTKLSQIFQRPGMQDVSVIYIDTCCQDRSFFASICPALGRGTSYYAVHDNVYQFKGAITVADNINDVCWKVSEWTCFRVCNSANPWSRLQWDKLCEQLRQDCDGILGFDTEYEGVVKDPLTGKKTMQPGGPHPVGTLALSGASVAVIFPLHALCPAGGNIPEGLTRLLADTCVHPGVVLFCFFHHSGRRCLCVQ